MAELLVRVADKINDDFYLNCYCTKAGDVIAVHPDGWNWGVDELALPFWRIVRLPKVSVDAASALLAPELALDPLNPPRTLQKRAKKLDLADPTIAAAIAFDPREKKTPSQDAVVAVAAYVDIAAATVAKPTIVDIAVIG